MNYLFPSFSALAILPTSAVPCARSLAHTDEADVVLFLGLAIQLQDR